MTTEQTPGKGPGKSPFLGGGIRSRGQLRLTKLNRYIILFLLPV